MIRRIVGTLLVNPTRMAWVESRTEGSLVRVAIDDHRFLHALADSVPCRVGGPNFYHEEIEVEGEYEENPPRLFRLVSARVVSDGDEFLLKL